MRRIFRTIDTSTLEGMAQADRLHDDGWLIDVVGLCTITFFKVIPEPHDYPYHRSYNQND